MLLSLVAAAVFCSTQSVKTGQRGTKSGLANLGGTTSLPPMTSLGGGQSTLTALVAAASSISPTDEATLGSRHNFAAYSCNHRTYNHWPKPSSAELLGLPSILRSSLTQDSHLAGEDVHYSQPLETQNSDVSVEGASESEQGLREMRLSMVPPFLDWGPGELCKPVFSSVDIINMSPDEEMTIRSVSADEEQFFYGSEEGFEPVEVQPHGNVTVPFLFVPQELGVVLSSVLINTSLGDFTYKFQGVGVANAYGVEPVKAVLATGQPLRTPFSVHNPGDQAIRVLEVFTPDDAFQLQLPDADSSKSGEQQHQAQLWKIDPKERKTVIQLTFVSRHPTQAKGFIHIRTDADTFVIGISVEVVVDRIVAQPPFIAFGTLTSSPARATRMVALHNTHTAAVDCASTSLPNPADSHVITAELTSQAKNIMPGEAKKSLRLTFNAGGAGHYRGLIVVECKPARGSARGGGYQLEIPYQAEVIFGSLDYRVGTVELVVSRDQDLAERAVEVTNKFAVPLQIIAAFTLDPALSLLNWNAGTTLAPGKVATLGTVHLNVSMARTAVGQYFPHQGVVGHEMVLEPATPTWSAGSKQNAAAALPRSRVFGVRDWSGLGTSEGGRLERHSNLPSSLISRSRIVVVTNVSVFTVPVAGYDGHLTFSPPKIDFNGVRPGQLRRRYFNVTNHNPVPVNVYAFTAFPCRKNTRKVDRDPDARAGYFPGGVRASLVSVRRPVERVLISGLVAADRVNTRNLKVNFKKVSVGEGGEQPEVLTTLESGYSAQFVLEINSTVSDTRSCSFQVSASVDAPAGSEEVGAAASRPACKTQQSDIFNDTLAVRLSSSSGEITFKPAAIRFGSSFSGRVDEMPLCVKSSYVSAVKVKSISSSDTRFYGRVEKDSIDPNGRTCIGVVVFDPSRKKVTRWEDETAKTGVPVRGSLTIQTELRNTLQIGVSGSIIQPRISPKGELEFPVTQIGKESEIWVDITNPSNYSITARLAQQMKESSDDEAARPFRLTKSLSGAGNAKVTYGHTLLLRGNERGRLGPIVYVPTSAQVVSDTLTVINNLTNTETVTLRGKGGTGILTFKNDGQTDSKCFASTNGDTRTSSADNCRVQFKIGKADVAQLLNGNFARNRAEDSTGEHEKFAIRRVFRAQNSGDLPMAITQVSAHTQHFSGSSISVITKKVRSGKGTRAKETQQRADSEDQGGIMVLQPGDEFELQVTIRVDFTVARFESIVDLSSSTGQLRVPIVVSIPRSQLAKSCTALHNAEETTLGKGANMLLALLLVVYVVSQLVTMIAEVYERETKADPLPRKGEHVIPATQAASTTRTRQQQQPTAQQASAPAASQAKPTKAPAPAASRADASSKRSNEKNGRSKPVETQPARSASKGGSGGGGGQPARRPAPKVVEERTIEQEQQERIRYLRDVLGNGVSTHRVEQLLIEADWEEERAADLFFQSEQKKAAALQREQQQEAEAARKKSEREKKAKQAEQNRLAAAAAKQREQKAREEKARREEKAKQKKLEAKQQKAREEKANKERVAKLAANEQRKRDREAARALRDQSVAEAQEREERLVAWSNTSAPMAQHQQQTTNSKPPAGRSGGMMMMSRQDQQAEMEAERQRRQQERLAAIVKERQAMKQHQAQLDPTQPPAIIGGSLAPSPADAFHSGPGNGAPASAAAAASGPIGSGGQSTPGAGLGLGFGGSTDHHASRGGGDGWGGGGAFGLGSSGWGGAAPSSSPGQASSLHGRVTGGSSPSTAFSPLDQGLGGFGAGGGFGSGGFFSLPSDSTGGSLEPGGRSIDDVDKMFGVDDGNFLHSGGVAGLLDEDEEDLSSEPLEDRDRSLFNRGRRGSSSSIGSDGGA